jgi:hypothetical protein
LFFLIPYTFNLEPLLQRPGYLAGTETAGTDIDPFNGTLADGFNPLEIGAPSFKGFVVSMTDFMSYLVAFAANATYLGHNGSFQLPSCRT